MRRLRLIKERVVQEVLPRSERVSEPYWSTVSAFSFSYSMGRTVTSFCQSVGISPEVGRVLIVGAAGGRDFHWLTGFGYAVDVLDLGAPPWECRVYLGDACARETWEQIGERYDLIVMCDVLEHLPEDYAALRHARAALKDGGYLFISLPYRHDAEVSHLRTYSEVTLKRLLSVAGYSVVWQKDRPGLVEAYPRLVNAVNYSLALLAPGARLGARLLMGLLRAEYFLNERTRKFYRIFGRSMQKGIVVAAKSVARGCAQDYVALNHKMYLSRAEAKPAAGAAAGRRKGCN